MPSTASLASPNFTRLGERTPGLSTLNAGLVLATFLLGLPRAAMSARSAVLSRSQTIKLLRIISPLLPPESLPPPRSPPRSLPRSLPRLRERRAELVKSCRFTLFFIYKPRSLFQRMQLFCIYSMEKIYYYTILGINSQ